MDLSKLIQLKENSPDDQPLEIKNYKELCILLGEEPKSGKSKQLQIKNWKRYFTWNNHGHKYLINEFYDKPLPEEENILKYKLMQYAIFEAIKKHYLYEYNLQKNDPDYQIKPFIKTINTLAFKIGYMNEYYFTYLYGKNKLASILDLSPLNIAKFYNKVTGYYYDDILTALKRLSKQKWITFDEIYYGKFITDEEFFIVKELTDYDDPVNKPHLAFKTVKRPLSNEEIQVYQSIQTRALQSFGCLSFSDFMRNGNSLSQLNKLINEMMMNELHCTNIYKAFRIATSPDKIPSYQQNLSKQLNKDFINRVLENNLSTSKKNRDKTIKKYNELAKTVEQNYDQDITDAILDYGNQIEAFKILSKYLLSIDEEDIKEFEEIQSNLNNHDLLDNSLQDDYEIIRTLQND